MYADCSKRHLPPQTRSNQPCASFAPPHETSNVGRTVICDYVGAPQDCCALEKNSIGLKAQRILRSEQCVTENYGYDEIRILNLNGPCKKPANQVRLPKFDRQQVDLG